MTIDHGEGGDELSDAVLNIPFMDAEHAALLAMYRALPAAASQSPRTCSAFANGFRELLAYARFHFGHEEEVMLRLAYPGYADHQRQHALLLKDGDDFLSNVQTYYESYDCQALAMYVKCWIRNHIRTHDSELATYLAAVDPQGVAKRELIVRHPESFNPHRASLLRH